MLSRVSACTWQVVDFTVRLTERQPIGWHASEGLLALPLPANQGLIPPAAEDPFSGLLRCIAVDEQGAPTDLDALHGVAKVERYKAGPSPEIYAARYNAVGIAPSRANAATTTRARRSLRDYRRARHPWG